MQRITAAQIEEMRANGYDRSTIAEAEAWLVKCQEADALIDEITVSFADVRLEDGIGLRESNGIDDYVGLEERKRLRAQDEKHDWRKIPTEVLNLCNAAPSFLDAQGMYFHLPAFLSAELRGEFHFDFINRLMWPQAFMDLLNQKQKQILIRCLEFAKSYPPWGYRADDIDQAIQRFQKSS